MLGQIKDGKQMCRALEAHFALYLALYKLCISYISEKNQVIERELKEAVIEVITEVREYQMSNKDIKRNHQNVLLSNGNINFEALIKEFNLRAASRIKADFTRTI